MCIQHVLFENGKNSKYILYTQSNKNEIVTRLDSCFFRNANTENSIVDIQKGSVKYGIPDGAITVKAANSNITQKMLWWNAIAKFLIDNFAKMQPIPIMVNAELYECRPNDTRSVSTPTRIANKVPTVLPHKHRIAALQLQIAMAAIKQIPMYSSLQR